LDCEPRRDTRAACGPWSHSGAAGSEPPPGGASAARLRCACGGAEWSAQPLRPAHTAAHLLRTKLRRQRVRRVLKKLELGPKWGPELRTSCAPLASRARTRARDVPQEAISPLERTAPVTPKRRPRAPSSGSQCAVLRALQSAPQARHARRRCKKPHDLGLRSWGLSALRLGGQGWATRLGGSRGIAGGRGPHAGAAPAGPGPCPRAARPT
jgi:hypothetical protein